MKKLFMIFILLGLVTILVVACGGGSTGSGNYVVHMNNQNFVQPSITIPKGSTITLTNDSSALHIIANGSWVNGTAQPMQESGAPTVNNVQISGNQSQTIGPFNTSGTYHLYCTVHPGMNLIVVVQ